MFLSITYVFGLCRVVVGGIVGFLELEGTALGTSFFDSNPVVGWRELPNDYKTARQKGVWLVLNIKLTCLALTKRGRKHAMH